MTLIAALRHDQISAPSVVRCAHLEWTGPPTLRRAVTQGAST